MENNEDTLLVTYFTVDEVELVELVEPVELLSETSSSLSMMIRLCLERRFGDASVCGGGVSLRSTTCGSGLGLVDLWNGTPIGCLDPATG